MPGIDREVAVVYGARPSENGTGSPEYKRQLMVYDQSTPHPVEALRDYAFGELPAERHPELERHLGICGECATELDRLRLTTAALRTLPDREMPQRIAFVSDKVFEPSPVTRFFAGWWNSAARLGFASAC